MLAILAVQAVARGQMTLDRPLPGRAFTLEQALQHRAGLPDYGAVPAYHRAVAAGGPAWHRDRMIRAARALRRDAPPGRDFAYSNIGYRLVGEAVEQAVGRSLADLLREGVTGPLGLTSVRWAQDTADLAAQHWPEGRGYDPGWVLHGLLLGSAGDAAALLHGLMAGRLVGGDLLARMCDARPIGGALPGRIWQTHGYGLGIMAGQVGPGARAIGHSGGGPFSCNACYHFPDRDDPCTVACFSGPPDAALPERAALALAYPSANSAV